MPGSPRKRERRERVKALMATTDSLDWLCARIASGENLVNICREMDVPYVAINEWIQQKDSRRHQYEQALRIRESHHKETLIRELMNAIAFDPEQLLLPDGTAKAMAEMPEEARRCIAGFEVAEIWGQVEDEGNAGRPRRAQIGHLKKFRFLDKIKAAELMARHLKMLTDKTEVTGKDGEPVKVKFVVMPERAESPEAWAEKYKPQELPPKGKPS